MTPNVIERNHVTVRGHGRPLVFAHGFGCDQRAWARVAPRFEATNTVVAFDYVGAGRSDRSAYDAKRYASIDGYVEDLLDVCHALELDAPVLVAHSVSTMVGLRAAVAEPKLFDRLVLLAPSPSFVDDPPYVGGFRRADIDGLLALMDANFMGWADAVSQMALSTPDLARELRESFCATDARCLRDFARVAFLTDHRSILPKVSTPSLVVQCAHDSLVPLAVGSYLATHLRNVSFSLADVPGHMPHMSHPDVVEALIRDYLARPHVALLTS